jgi:hypothetical protein
LRLNLKAIPHLLSQSNYTAVIFFDCFNHFFKNLLDVFSINILNRKVFRQISNDLSCHLFDFLDNFLFVAKVLHQIFDSIFSVLIDKFTIVLVKFLF